MDYKAAILNSKNIYPDVIRKAMPQFDVLFADQIAEYNGTHEVYEQLGEEEVEESYL